MNEIPAVLGTGVPSFRKETISPKRGAYLQYLHRNTRLPLACGSKSPLRPSYLHTVSAPLIFAYRSRGAIASDGPQPRSSAPPHVRKAGIEKQRNHNTNA